jgi:hypothetical protein
MNRSASAVGVLDEPAFWEPRSVWATGLRRLAAQADGHLQPIKETATASRPR